jgi:serine-type D-Ala-D-Ala carboxypeptidase/endopeptidase (penicillin-binding protein 4)
MKRALLLFWLATAAIAQPLAERIQRLFDPAANNSSAARTAFWGIQVTDLATGKTLYELNANRFFVPASNTKLFTTSLALTRLGPDFTFQTRVIAMAAPDADGRIAGDIRLVGGGDPNLSARPIPYRVGPITGDPLTALADLADQVAAKGIHRIDGDVVGDDTRYVWEPFGNGWSIDDPLYDYGAPVSALTVNDNTFSLSIRPGAKEGEAAALALHPAVEYYTLDNRIRTVAAGGERKIHYTRAPGGMTLELWGTIPLRDHGEDLTLGIDDPALYAAMAFRQALEDRGIAVEGGATAQHLNPNEVADLKHGEPLDAPEGTELASRESASLLEDLRITAKVSQNLHAEMALRAVGKARRQIGSRQAGLAEMRAFLAEVGIGHGSYTFADGSGLSRLDLVSPAAVAGLLAYAYRSAVRDQWLSLLPVSGQDGTLHARFKGNRAAGRIRAKTGSLSHVSALSGYAQRSDGKMLAFSILVNNYNGPATDVTAAIDRICELMVE